MSERKKGLVTKKQIEALLSEKFLYLSSVLITLIIFGMWDGWLLVSLGSQFKGAAFPSIMEISNQVTWTNYVNKILDGDVFPENYSDNGIFATPVITFWILAALKLILGDAVASATVNVLIPTASYAIIVKIFRRYLSVGWAIFLSSLAIFSIPDYPFRNFLVEALFYEQSFDFGQIARPEIMGSPFPSLSLMFFVWMFYVSTAQKYLSSRRISIISIGWLLQGFIHPLNFAFGIPFWIFILFLNFIRPIIGQRQRADNTRFLIGLMFAILGGAFVLFSLANLSISPEQSNMYWTGHESDLNTLTYIFFPLLLLLILAFFLPIDPIEIIYKFNFIFIAMVTQLILLFVLPHLSIGSKNIFVSHRLGYFFLYGLYIIPVLHYFSRTNFLYQSYGHRESYRFKLCLLFSFIFNKLAKIYLPTLQFLLILFLATNAYRTQIWFSTHIEPHYLASQKMLFELKREESDNIYVATTDFGNILILANKPNGSVLQNTFIKNMPIKEAMQIHVKYGKSLGWSEDRFINFMSGSDLDNKEFIENIMTNSGSKGLGFWLTFNEAPTNKHVTDEYRSLLSNAWQNSVTKTPGIKKIQSPKLEEN